MLTDEQLTEQLQQGQTYHLPFEPNWFYLDDKRGEDRLYIVASSQPLPDVEDLYARYSQADDVPGKQDLLSGLPRELDTIEETGSKEAVGWVFAFNHQ